MRLLYLVRRVGDGDGVTRHLRQMVERVLDRGGEVSLISSGSGEDPGLRGIDQRTVTTYFEGNTVYDDTVILNNEFKRAAREMGERHGFDLVHAHDWTTVAAGVVVSKRFDVPLVVSYESTENERGFGDSNSSMISHLEWEGGFESSHILALGENTRDSLVHDLGVPREKIRDIDTSRDCWTDEVIALYESLLSI
ncbi:MAG: glycosyltransferase family 4 protein [Halobacteria archaeon]|nr:glycosyltransferase family 4 protein [Halobacteria archaeon]